MGRKKRWSVERRREALEVRARSGLSWKVFADRNGSPYTMLLSWRKREGVTVPSRLVQVEIADPPCGPWRSGSGRAGLNTTPRCFEWVAQPLTEA